MLHNLFVILGMMYLEKIPVAIVVVFLDLFGIAFCLDSSGEKIHPTFPNVMILTQLLLLMTSPIAPF